MIPPGRAGLIVLAVALVPVALAKVKPLAKKLGEELIKIGENLKGSAAEVVEAPPKAEPAKVAPAPKAKNAKPKVAAKPKTAKAKAATKKPAPPKPKAKT